MDKPEIKTYKTKNELANQIALLFANLAQKKVKAGGRFSVALSGGSTPKLLYDALLADFRDALDWSRVDFFWSDERYVPIDHPDSNIKLALDNLLRPLKISDSQLFLVHTDFEPDEAAAEYQKDILEYFDGEPAFDLILLGLGDDGHTASLFPESKALNATRELVAANWVEKFKTWRITFTYPLLNRGKNVLFMVAGEQKATVVRDILEEKSTYPAARVQPAGKLYWYLDEAASRKLFSN